MNVVLYARTATEQQECPSGAERQLEQLRIAAGHEGWPVLGEYGDAAKSGAQRERSGLVALMERVTVGDVRAVLVTDGARLSRDASHLFEIEATLSKLNVRILSLDTGLRPSATLLGRPSGLLSRPAKRVRRATQATPLAKS